MSAEVHKLCMHWYLSWSEEMHRKKPCYDVMMLTTIKSYDLKYIIRMYCAGMYNNCSVVSLQVDLLVFDTPQDKEAEAEHQMTADKGVWHCQVHSLCPPPPSKLAPPLGTPPPCGSCTF